MRNMITAKLRHLHIAPRKVRLVADLVRGKTAEEAGTILNFTVKKAAQPILKLLNSALANAKNNFQLDPSNLYLSEITVDEGPKIKRWRARARGSAYEIQKKTSHINISLEEITKSKKVKKIKTKEIPQTAEKEVKVEGAEEKAEKTPKTDKRDLRAEVKKPAPLRLAKKIFRRQVF